MTIQTQTVLTNPLPELPLEGGALFIDNSGWMEGMSTCYRYLEYKSLRKRILAVEKPALNFGSAQHLCREFRYAVYKNKAVDQQYYENITQVLTEFFAEHPPTADDWRTLNWAVEVDKRYNTRYFTEEFSLLKYDQPIPCPHCGGIGQVMTSTLTGTELEVIRGLNCRWCNGTGKRDVIVELPFTIPLYTHDAPTGQHIPVVFTGRIDLAVMLDGGLWVVDHKHVGMLGQQFWNEQRMASQHRGYVWAFFKAYGKLPKGYIVNAVRTKEPPQYVTDNRSSSRGKKQSPEEWWNESIQRERYYVDEARIVEWENNTIDIAEEFFWHYWRGHMPMKTKWCSMYGGCPYYQVCQMIPTDRLRQLNSGEYTDNTWTPLNKPTQSKQ